LTDGPYVATPATGLRARWRHHKATRPHLTVRISLILTRLRLYRPMMMLLHKWGQCFMTISRVPGDGGRARRYCTWCGNTHVAIDEAAVEAELRAAASIGRES
jgi:hypothetical protein